MIIRLAIVTCVCFLTMSVTRADDGPAIAAIEKAGAVVTRDDARKDRPIVLVTYLLRLVTDDGIRALKEIEELPAIQFVGSGDTELTASTIRALQGKKSLKRLSIAFAKVSDESAEILGTLKSLESLDLQKQIEMSPQGFDEILRLTNLKELTISGRLVNDEVLEDLAKIAGLKSLTIESVFVTDDGIASLKRLKNLRTLRIYLGSNVTSAGVRQLADLRLTNLEITYLDVNNNKLKDLRILSGLKTLRMISAVNVTNDGIPFLAELKELKELDLSDATLTNAGIKDLKSALPSCNVVIDARKRD